MNHTANYNLNQWEATDSVTRADFNADNAAIDAALKTVADAASGGLRCAVGSYTGTGEYNAANPNSLTFDFEPQMLLVIGQGTSGFAVLPMLRGAPRLAARYMRTLAISCDTEIYITWDGATVSWYSYSGAQPQANASGAVYWYFAIG